MNNDAAKATAAGSSKSKGKQGMQVDDIPKTVPIDTVALQERQRARQQEARRKRPWIGIVLIVLALALIYFLFG